MLYISDKYLLVLFVWQVAADLMTAWSFCCLLAKYFTDQMAEWYRRAFASGSVDLGFDSELGQTNDSEIGIHSFLA